MRRRYLPERTPGLVLAAASRLDQGLAKLERKEPPNVVLRALRKCRGVVHHLQVWLGDVVSSDDRPERVSASQRLNDHVARQLWEIKEEIRYMTSPQLLDHAKERTDAQATGSTALAEEKLDEIKRILDEGTPDQKYHARRRLELFCVREMMRERGVELK